MDVKGGGLKRNEIEDSTENVWEGRGRVENRLRKGKRQSGRGRGEGGS